MRHSLRVEHCARNLRGVVLVVQRIFLPDACDVIRDLVVPLRIEKPGEVAVEIRRRERGRDPFVPVRVLRRRRFRHRAECVVHHLERALRIVFVKERRKRHVNLRRHQRRLAVFRGELLEIFLHLRRVRLLSLALRILDRHEPIERLGDLLALGVVLQYPLHRGRHTVHTFLPRLLLSRVQAQVDWLRHFLQPDAGELQQRSVAATLREFVREFILHVVEQLPRSGLHVRSLLRIERAGEEEFRHVVVGKVHILVLRILRHEFLHDLQRTLVVLRLVEHVEHLEVRARSLLALGIRLIHFLPRLDRLVPLVRSEVCRAEEVLRLREVRLRARAHALLLSEARDESRQFGDRLLRFAPAEDLARREPRVLRLRAHRMSVAQPLECRDRAVVHRRVALLAALRLLDAPLHHQRLRLDLRLRIRREQIVGKVERLREVALFQRGRGEDLHRLAREAPVLVVLLPLGHDLLGLVRVALLRERVCHEQREIVAGRVALEILAEIPVRLQRPRRQLRQRGLGGGPHGRLGVACLRLRVQFGKLLGVREAHQRRERGLAVLVLFKKLGPREQHPHQRTRLVGLVEKEENPRDGQPRREELVRPALVFLPLAILIRNLALDARLHRKIIHRAGRQHLDLLLQHRDLRRLRLDDLLDAAHRAERLQRRLQQLRLPLLVLLVVPASHTLAARELELADEKYGLVHQREIAALQVRLRQRRFGILKERQRPFHIVGRHLLASLHLHQRAALDEERLPDPHQRLPRVRARRRARHDCESLDRLIVHVRLQQQNRTQELHAVHVAALRERHDEIVVRLDPLGHRLLLRLLPLRRIGRQLRRLHRDPLRHEKLRHLARGLVYSRIPDQFLELLGPLLVKALLQVRHRKPELRIERTRREHLVFREELRECLGCLLEFVAAEKPVRHVEFERIRAARPGRCRGCLRVQHRRGCDAGAQHERGESEAAGC